MILVCACGKVCTSHPGITLHHKNCPTAKKLITDGKKGYKIPRQESSIDNVSTPELRKLVEFAESVAVDGDMAICNGNKSAGRRARGDLLRIRDLIVPIRKRIHDRTIKCRK